MITISVEGKTFKVDTVELTVSEDSASLRAEGMGYKVEAQVSISDNSTAEATVELSGRATRPDGKGLSFTSSSTSKVEEF